MLRVSRQRQTPRSKVRFPKLPAQRPTLLPFFRLREVCPLQGEFEPKLRTSPPERMTGAFSNWHKKLEIWKRLSVINRTPTTS